MQLLNINDTIEKALLSYSIHNLNINHTLENGEGFQQFLETFSKKILDIDYVFETAF